MIRQVLRDRRGGVTILIAGSMAVLLGMGALAIDMGSVYLDSRQLQGVADAAALSAVTDLAAAPAAATLAVNGNGWTRPSTIAVQTGRYVRDSGIPVAARFTPTTTSPDAARVTITAQSPLWFAGVLTGRRSMTIVRRATASRSPQAAFSIGTRLASVDGGIANALIGALAGGSLSLSVADYNALLGTDVDLFAFSDALRTRLGLTGASYNDVLATSTTVPHVVGAMASALDAEGKTAAANAARKLANGSAARSLLPSTLVKLGAFGSRTQSGGAKVAVSAWDLVQETLQLAGGARQVSLDLGVSIPGLASTKLWFATGERLASSPWLTMTGDGAMVVRTAQSRLYLETNVGVTGLTGIASLKLPLYIELGEATARLSNISCAGSGPASASLSVTPAVGHVSIATLTPSAIGALSNFAAIPVENEATLATVTLLTIKAQSRINLGGTAAQTVPFTRAEVESGTIKSVSTIDLSRGVVGSLITTPPMMLSLAGLNLTGVLGLVGAALAPAAAPLDGLVTTVTGLLGLRVGQVDVRMNGLRCGLPLLVA